MVSLAGSDILGAFWSLGEVRVCGRLQHTYHAFKGLAFKIGQPKILESFASEAPALDKMSERPVPLTVHEERGWPQVLRLVDVAM